MFECDVTHEAPTCAKALWRRGPREASVSSIIEHGLRRPTLMSDQRQLFPPPPAHPSRSRDVSYSAPPSNNLLRKVPPPPLPARSAPRSVSSQAVPIVPAAPAIPRPERIPGGVDDIEDIELDDNESIADIQTICEEELSETQLRELYDEEEINRFLYLFSTVSSTKLEQFCAYFKLVCNRG